MQPGGEAEASRLRQALDAAQADLAAASRRAERLDRALRAAGDDLQVFRQDIAAARSEAAAHAAELDAARQDAARLRDTLAASTAHAAADGAQAAAEIRRLEAEHRALRGELAAVTAHAARLETRLTAVLASTSWRLTLPMRAALEHQPGLARLLRRTTKLAWWGATFQLPRRWRQWRTARRPRSLPPPAVAAPSPPPSPPPAALAQDPPAAAPSPPPASADPLAERIAAESARIQALEAGRAEDAARADAVLARVAGLEQRAGSLEALIEAERSRVDWALGDQEGVTEQIDFYHAYRETAGYQAAYTEATPLVTVCVATMDRAGLLLERAIPSLLAQTYRNLQILVVGDHCTDDTAERLAALRDDRIRFVNLPARGPYPRPGIDRWRVAGSNAMNHALSLAEGQFVTHLDDDDAMVPHRIETLLAAAQEDRADFLWHPFWYETGDGTWTRIGDGRLILGQVSTGSIFYHRFFARFPWDVRAYRLREPGDWNRLRKIGLLRPRLRFVDDMLLYHHAEQSQAPFVARPGERFLD